MPDKPHKWFHVTSRRRTTSRPEMMQAISAAAADAEPLKPSTLYRLVQGVDSEPVEMAAAEISQLGDQMGLILRSGKFPMTVSEVLAAVDSSGALPSQDCFLVSEAGQIDPKSAPDLERDMRFAIVRSSATDADLVISTGTAGDPAAIFLQVAGWDEGRGLFNYYMRIEKTWVWAGNSFHALDDSSRGHGCFDSHVNGSLVMKELKIPWINWESNTSTIVLAPDDPIRASPLFKRVAGAEKLELTVRGAIHRWTSARLRQVVQAGQVAKSEQLLRQLFTTTTINLASSMSESRVLASDPARKLTPPAGFWLNVDSLLNDLGVLANPGRPQASSADYAASLKKFDFALVEDGFRQPGDAFFAFVVPEAAFEDIDVVSQMVQGRVVSDRFAACALMVDFPNPVYSERRAALMKYVAAGTATMDPAGGGLSGQIAGRILAAAAGLPASSPEAEFAGLWQAGDGWASAFAKPVEAYISAVESRIATSQGFEDYVRLAESRRREFKATRLFEFSLTLPTTNIPVDAPLLRMNADGTVSEKPR